MKFKLKDLISIKHGYAFKGEDFSDQPTQLQILTPGNVTIGGGFQFGKGKWLSLTTEYPKEYEFKAGDMFVSMTDLSKAGDTLGYPAIIPVSDRVMLHNQRLGRVEVLPNVEEVVLKKYLYYAMRTREYHAYIVSGATGTTVRHTSPSKILDYEFDLPSYQEQQRIVGILSPIEDKINVLNDVNDNLLDLGITYTEEMLVKNDYPVSTIKSMNLTVSDHVANGSFKALKDNVEIVEDGGYALFLRNTDLKADLNGDRRFVTKSSYEFLKKSRLFGGEVIISNVGDVGSVYHVPYLDVPMVAGNNVVFLQSEESWLTDYLYFYFKSRIGQHDIDSITSGSAQQKFNKTDFRALEIPVILEHDVTILTKLIDNLNSNTQEIRTLMDTRDTLLKKLLN
ncbi:restriction endonuclease subunit S [Neobacillus sp.]|uniref:restriction endonuclease subunit S n=1 Tax=Neobacillus sp. TaxID=2675273 RepID=UPI00289BC9A9|nr:restriction endonuclease subunit S [Neobacillus sp.]